MTIAQGFFGLELFFIIGLIISILTKRQE